VKVSPARRIQRRRSQQGGTPSVSVAFSVALGELADMNDI
jgi:hypothetical protein